MKVKNKAMCDSISPSGYYCMGDKGHKERCESRSPSTGKLFARWKRNLKKGSI